jgi:hypothetical protein
LALLSFCEFDEISHSRIGIYRYNWTHIPLFEHYSSEAIWSLLVLRPTDHTWRLARRLSIHGKCPSSTGSLVRCRGEDHTPVTSTRVVAYQVSLSHPSATYVPMLTLHTGEEVSRDGLKPTDHRLARCYKLHVNVPSHRGHW